MRSGFFFMPHPPGPGDARAKIHKTRMERRAKHRKAILELLNGDEAALAEIEAAVDWYFSMLDYSKLVLVETPDQIRKDLAKLYRALADLESLFDGGRRTALRLFMEELVAVGAIKDFGVLQAALDVNGSRELAEAAKNAMDGYQVRQEPGEEPGRKPGRKRSVPKACRIELIVNILRAGERSGMKLLGDGSDMERVIGLVYASVGLFSDIAEDIKSAIEKSEI